MDSNRTPQRSPLSSATQAAVITLLVVCGSLTSGCSTPNYQHPKPLPALQASETEQQQADALQHRLTQQQRLNRVAWPLLIGNSKICGERVKAKLGMQFGNSHSFGPAVDSSRSDSAQTKSTNNTSSLRDSALRSLQLGEAVQVLSVVAGSAAEQAGILPGDKLVSLDSKPFQTGKPGLTHAAEMLQHLKPDQPAQLTVYRQQQTFELQVTPINGCDYPLILTTSDQINAFADHRNIIITEGMLDFTPDDRDLALVIAHELAHNVLGHIPATTRNALIGSTLDLLLLSQGVPSPGIFTLGGLVSYSQPFETEADYVSLYLLARADYPLEGSANFWRRMSRSRPDHINVEAGQSHPGSADRYLIMQATIDEIAAKRRHRRPLTPNPRATTN